VISGADIDRLIEILAGDLRAPRQQPVEHDDTESE